MTYPRDNFRIRSEHSQDPESALVIWLAEADSQDPAVLATLLERYLADVHQMVQAFLEIFNGVRPKPERVTAVTMEVFTSAVRQLETINGTSSVQEWLAHHAAVATKPRRPRPRPPAATGPNLWDTFITSMDWDAKVALFLRYALGMNASSIAYVLGVSEEQSQMRLTAARQMSQVLTLHSRQDFEAAMAHATARYWPQLTPTIELLEMYAEEVSRRLKRPAFFMQTRLPLKEIVWVSTLIMALLVWLGYSTVTTPTPGRQLFDPTAVPRAVIIEPVPLDLRMAALDEPPMEIQFVGEPDYSLDGRFLVYAAAMTSESAAVYLQDTITGEVRQVDVTGDGTPANQWSFSPVISEDGIWIAFGSTATNLAGPVYDCDQCSNIYMYNQVTGEIRLLSRGLNDVLDGNSYAPAISGDGRWVVFWSTASTLVAQDFEMCRTPGEVFNCPDLFVYDREANALTRIPIGRLRQYREASSQAGISADGRWLAITIRRDDQIAAELNVAGFAEVFLYDRVNGVYERVNTTADGEPGNQGAYGVAISGDARYVAFASRASNLVPDDHNGQSDVFLKNRETGALTLVSRSVQGGTGNRISGGSDVGQPVQISFDGRFVLFPSLATDLLQDTHGGCPTDGVLQAKVCSNLFLYDQVNDTIELVSRPRPEPYNSFFPGMAGNGQLVAFTSQGIACFPPATCYQATVYDRQTQQTRYAFAAAAVPTRAPTSWVLTGMLTGHMGWVNTVAFSPDSKVISSGGNDGNIHTWRVSTQESLHEIAGHSQAVVGLAYHPDGDVMASGSHDASVNLWYTWDGSRVTSLASHTGLVRSLAFAPSGDYLAVGALRSVWLWALQPDAVTLLGRQPYDGSFVEALAFSGDGALMALSPGDHTVWLRTAPDGDQVLRLGGHTGKVKQIAFSPDGRYLASSAEDKRVNLWKIMTAEDGYLSAVYQYTIQYDDWVQSLAFSPDGQYLGTASFDHSLRLWQVSDGTLAETLWVSSDMLISLAFSPDGHSLAAGTANGRVALWEHDD